MLFGPAPEKGDDSRYKYSSWIDLGIQVAITLALSVILLALLGRWLDEQFGTTPFLLVAGALWGAIGGTIWLVVRVKRFADKFEEEEKRSNSKNDGEK
jgi:F0F1-type ATP synthase assembly protein I